MIPNSYSVLTLGPDYTTHNCTSTFDMIKHIANLVLPSHFGVRFSEDIISEDILEYEFRLASRITPLLLVR